MVRRVLTRLFLVLVALALVGPAFGATAWWLISPDGDACILASAATRLAGPAIASPQTELEQMRAAGIASALKVWRGADGGITIASLTVNGTTIAWYATRDLCDRTRAALRGKGVLASPSELR